MEPGPQQPQQRRPRHKARIALFALAGLLLVIAAALGIATFLLQGERLGRLVTGALGNARGKIEVKAITWRAGALLDLLTDRPTPLSVDGVKIIDADGNLVLQAPHIDVKVRPRSAIGAKIYLHDLRIGHDTFWRFAPLKSNPLDNGFLTSFAPKPPPAPLPPGAMPPSDLVFEIVNANLDGLTAVFDFAEAWGLELRDVKATATLLVEGDFVGWDVQGLDARRGGYLRILHEQLPFDRVDVPRCATTREWPNNIFLNVRAARTGHSTLIGKGFFTGIYDYKGIVLPPGIDMRAEFDDAADALGAVAAGHQYPGLHLGGKGAKIVADLKDPFATLKIDLHLAGLDVDFGSYSARALAIAAKVAVDPLDVAIEDLSFGAPGGGRFALAGGLKAPPSGGGGMAAKARLRWDRFTTGSYVPASLRSLAAGKLNGRLALAANFGSPSADITGIDLNFERSRSGGLPRSLRVRGNVSASPARAATTGLVIDVPGASAGIKGEVAIARRLLALGLRAGTSNLPRLLGTLGLPPLARGAALSIDVEGPFTSPDVRGDATVSGITAGGDLPEVPDLKARFGLDNGVAHIDLLAGKAFGGAIQGHGQAKLWDETVAHMVRAPLIDFRLEGKQIALESFVAAGILNGRVSFLATASGPTDKIRLRVALPDGAELIIMGAPWSLGAVELEADRKALTLRGVHLAEKAGAQVDVSGRMPFHTGGMAWDIAVRDVALERLPWVVETGIPLRGRFSVTAHVTGTVAHPTVAGEITLSHVVARGIALADSRIVLVPKGKDPGAIAIDGNLFGKFHLTGLAANHPRGPRASLNLEFNHLVLQDLLPELTQLQNGEGVLSGAVTVDVRPDRPLSIEARLSEVFAAFDRPFPDSIDGHPPTSATSQRVEVRNATPLRLQIAGDKITLDPLRLTTDGGNLEIAGGMDGETVTGTLAGHLDLDLLQPFLKATIEHMTGDVSAHLDVSGSRTRPRLEGQIAIASPVKIKPVGVAKEITIPSGTIRLSPPTVELANLAISVDGAALVLSGTAELSEAFAPTRFEVDARGDVSAALLEALAPGTVTDASGLARIAAHLKGTPTAPEISARIDLGTIELRLRDLGRTFAIQSGKLELSNRELVLRDVLVNMDEQGQLLIGAAGVAPGRVAIKSLYPNFEIGAVHLPLHGERLTYRIPGAVEIDDLGFSLDLAGDTTGGFTLGGDVRLVSGRYIQDFSVTNLVLAPRTNESAVYSALNDTSLLQDTRLNLRVRTIGDSFVVQNNLAPEIHMVVDLRVGGVLGDPSLAGEVRPTDGRFHVPGVRGDFDLVPNVNHVTFISTKSPSSGETPELNLEAQNLITDSSGREHNVRIRISGPINQAAIDLSTDDGLDRNQTLLLLIAGRTTGDADRFGTQNPSVGSNVRTGTDVAGQITRDSVSSLVEPYIDDTLQLLTGRQINLRPTIGADGFELRLRARMKRQTELQLSYLRGFQNQQRSRAEASLWLVDYLTLRGVAEQLTLSPQQGITEEFSTLRMELTLDFPIRFWRP